MKTVCGYWPRLLKFSQELFDDLIKYFDTMLDGNSAIKHFDILDNYTICDEEVDIIKEKYFHEIESELNQWIRKEHSVGNLFNRSFWKPVQLMYILSDCYLGYKKMFLYKHYYFMLGVSHPCENQSLCKYCQAGDYMTHFELYLLGWKVEGSDKLQPIGQADIPKKHNFIPEFYREQEDEIF